MPNIKIKRQHTLGKTECRKRVENIAQVLQKKLDTTWSWEGDSLVFQRPGASGIVSVSDNSVAFDVKLSMLLSPLKGVIEEEINKRADDELA